MTKSSSTRFCYQRKFYHADSDGNVVSTMREIVYTGETGRRIMAAFPTSASSSYEC